MNRIYKLIWSKVKNCYVVTSELAKNHGKNCARSKKSNVLRSSAVFSLSKCKCFITRNVLLPVC